MPTPIFNTALVRELRGSPLTVLVAILLLEQSGQVPATAQLLRDVTGYGDHTITDSLRALESPTRQIVRRITGGWRLTKGFQLPLELQNRDIRDNVLSSSCSFLNKNQSDSEEQEETQNRDIRGFALNHAAALRAGIRDPKASIIAHLEHVTPEYIAAHVAQAKQEGHSIGTAIYRIINQWDHAPLVEPNPNGHPGDCKCTSCSVARFTGRW